MPCTWISLKEAQTVLGRTEGSVRRLIKRYQIRTKKVVCLKGWELLLAWEDLQKLLPENGAATIPRSLSPATRPENSPAVQQPLPSPSAVAASEILQDFQATLKSMAEASNAQLELLGRLGEKLENAQKERLDVVDTQRQFLDSLANINRGQKSQAAALLQVEEHLKDSRSRRPGPGWPLAVLAALLLGAGMTWFFSGTSKPEKPVSNSMIEIEQRLTHAREQQEKALEAEAHDRQQRFSQLEERLKQLEAGLEKALPEASPENAKTAEGDEGAGQALRQLQADLEREQANLRAGYEKQLQELEEANKAKSFELNHLRLRLRELEERAGQDSAENHSAVTEGTTPGQRP